MRSYVLPCIGLLFIIAVFLIFISVSMQQTELYSLEHDKASTQYHTNVESEKRGDFNSSNTLTPLMDDLFSFSGQISVNVEMNDLSSMSDNLAKYKQKIGSFDTIQTNLGMSGSDLGIFAQSVKTQWNNLQEIYNISESFDSLNRLKIQYRDQNDTTALSSIRFQERAILPKMQRARDQYVSGTENLSNIGSRFQLRSSSNENSIESLNQYIHKLSLELGNGSDGKFDSITPRIFFLVDPEEGIYQTPLKLNGFIIGGNVSNQEIHIRLDNESFTSVNSDDIGLFHALLNVEMIPTGSHIFIAEWDGMNSEAELLHISEVNSTLTLKLSAFKDQPVVRASGNLITNISVRNTPILFQVNNETWNSTITNQKGEYSSNLTFPKGTYEFCATFKNESFPIHESQSLIYEVVSSGDSITSIRSVDAKKSLLSELLGGSVYVILLVCIGGICGGAWYLLRRRTIHYPNPEIDDGNTWKNDKGLTENHPDFEYSDDINLITTFHEFLSRKGLSEASCLAYQILLCRIARDINNQSPQTMTPREVVQAVQNQSYVDILKAFVTSYEQIRYGGHQDEESCIAFEDCLKEIDLVLHGGIDDE